MPPGRFSQATFLQEDPLVGGKDVPPQDPMWNISSVLFVGIDGVGLRRDKTCKESMLYDLGQVTELLSASSPVQFYCEDTEIMHASAFHDC